MPETEAPPPSKRPRLCFDLNMPPAPEQPAPNKPKRKYSKPIRLVPVNDAGLRRSKRTTKYDGFKITNFSERRMIKSKVAPRIIPNAVAVIVKQKVEEGGKKEIPEPTTITSIQHIGVHMCGIDAAELTPVILLSEEAGEPARATESSE